MANALDLELNWEEAFGENDESTSLGDALLLSLNNKGYVDIDYICEIANVDLDYVIDNLYGSIYLNPEMCIEQDERDPNIDMHTGWELSSEYLSGNLREKYKDAQVACKMLRHNKRAKELFEQNLSALKKAMPEATAFEDIYVTLGSPWIPAKIIKEFVKKVIGLPLAIDYDPFTGIWNLNQSNSYEEIIELGGYSYLSKANLKYGTKRITAHDLLSKTLNMQTIAIFDEVNCTTTKSGKRKQLNETETILAIEKQKLILEEFDKWLSKETDIQEELEAIYNNKYGCVKRKTYDGSFLEFPTMARGQELLPYQKNAVARIILSPNTLLAHDVGAGKTYVCVAAGMELKRMGLSDKNLYVVPNNIVGQWKDIFKNLYPDSNILTVEPKGFKPDKRQAVLKDISETDYDAVIMAYSCFELIPLSKHANLEELKEKLKQTSQAKFNNPIKGYYKSTSRKAIDRMEESLRTKIYDLEITGDKDTSKEYKGICFDELGFTRMFVDEAHNFKNVPISTKITRVLGINAAGSKKCEEMLRKVHYIQRINGGRGVVMATGTPITNSITDVFILQKYLQDGELKVLDIHNFDSWVGLFAERQTEFEIDVDTNSYRLTTRLNKFHNLAELTSILSGIADFHQVDASAGIPEFDGYTDIVVDRSEDLSGYLKEISVRAEKVRTHQVSAKEDNLLKITTDGRKAALDIRLVKEDLPYSVKSKIEKCATQVFNIYFQGIISRTTQLIFCDTSTPKEGFNVYSELKNRLVSLGVTESDIAFVHDADNEKKRNALFEDMRNGNIRILIGSTFKLGLGVNVQDNLIALHHIDIPWRPADMVQREGRILRQGNVNKKVQIFRYITEGSFDAYSWQLLETKQRFISELLAGSLDKRDAGDVDDTVLSYAEVKALAVGNPLIKRRVELNNDLGRYVLLQRKAIENRLGLEQEQKKLLLRIPAQKERVKNCKFDVEFVQECINVEEFEYKDQEYRKEVREELHAAIIDNSQSGEDIELMVYRGFSVILPSNLLAGSPVIILKRFGEYKVEVGNSINGQIIRIDNYIDKLSDKLDAYVEGLYTMEGRLEAVSNMLLKREDYSAKIAYLKDEIKKVDDALGVKWSEK